MFVAIFSNSFVGKSGNIGLRIKFILDALSSHGVRTFCFARGYSYRSKDTSLKHMGIFKHVPRVLHAFNIYFARQFEVRELDAKLFESLAKREIEGLTRITGTLSPKVALLQECSPSLIKRLHQEGFSVVLDIPIAPASYDRRLLGIHPDCGLRYSEAMHLRETESFHLADHIVVPSPFVAQEIERLNIASSKISIVPFGVSSFSSYERVPQLQKSGVDFCFLGTINFRKGIRYLLEAFNDPLFASDRLHLCGRLFPELKELIKKHPYSENIILPGFVDPSTYLRQCDVYVFPSLLEGSSKSIYEAMSLGLPVITTFESGSIVRDLVDGFIVPCAEVSTLREKMRQLKLDPSLRKQMGTSALELVSHYTWTDYSKKVLEVLQTKGVR